MKFDAIRYRGIDGLSIKKAAKINLIVGPNGIGKTSLLEAIWLFTNRDNPITLWHSDLSRSGYEYVNPVAELGSGKMIHLAGIENGIKQDYKVTFEELTTKFTDHKRTRPYTANQKFIVGKMHVEIDNKKLENFSMQYSTREGFILLPGAEHAVYPSMFLISDSSLGIDLQRFSEIVRQGTKDALVRKLRLFHSLLSDIEIVVEDDGEPYILATVNEDKRFRLEDLGSGIERIFTCFMAMFASRNSLVCIDRVEASLHYSAFLKFWKLIHDISEEFNTQIFATTHSKECIDAAIRASSGRKKI